MTITKTITKKQTETVAINLESFYYNSLYNSFIFVESEEKTVTVYPGSFKSIQICSLTDSILETVTEKYAKPCSADEFWAAYEKVAEEIESIRNLRALTA